LGYLLNFSLVLGAMCTALHLAIAGLLRWMGIPAPLTSPAQTLAAQPVRITER
jgi:hypothetical protein